MNHTYLKSLFLATLVIPMISFAGEITNETENRYLVAPRQTEKTNTQQEGSSNFFTRTYPTVYFPSGMHCLLSVSAFGDMLDIEDGSRWKISPYDAAKVANWGAQDPIIITQNHRWFSQYSYRIINQATGGILEANLFLGPFKDGPYTRYITSMDMLRGEIVLNDLTRWQVSVLDANEFREWLLYDAVIIGYNSGWDSDCQGLLINVNKNQHIRAAQF